MLKMLGDGCWKGYGCLAGNMCAANVVFEMEEGEEKFEEAVKDT